jgi:AraC family transcriptional regulator of adaptative response / DNA-3-methyladenine glycosylase II|tara:strand:- start:1981 stop:3180 length:1200 start_codon:yes stop_codon:yes gene_type:complete
VGRALRLIAEGALDESSVDDLADRLGVGTRHLNRLFMKHLGASPSGVAQTRRLHNAKELIDATDLPMVQVALSAGYRSTRRFNTHIKETYGCPPSTLRKKASDQHAGGYQFRLNFRPPYDFQGMIGFLQRHVTPAVELVEGSSYSRTMEVDGATGTFTVDLPAGENCLRCNIRLAESKHLIRIVERIKRLFDLSADSAEIARCLQRDPGLKPLVQANPGLRIPGGWDGYEIAVRTIIGQQVSVAGANTTAARLVHTYGSALTVDGPLDRLFPTADSLSRLDTERAGMPVARAQTIKQLSEAVCRGDVSFDYANDPDLLYRQLTTIKGIGPWTAGYIAMRAMGDPDVFPRSDLVLQRMAGHLFGTDTERELLQRSQRWRPWRAYAAMYLWQMATDRNERR